VAKREIPTFISVNLRAYTEQANVALRS